MPVSVDNKSFQDVQNAFTRHIRDPENQPLPGEVEERRMAIYSGLFYRNVESFIANSFPVLRKITPDDQWHRLIRDYFKNHRAHTPLFPKMPQEFLQYLEQERHDENDPPFMLELAHYEWVELALSLDVREINYDGVNADGDLLAGAPVLNPLTWLLSYRFPVHRIEPAYLPVEAPEQPTYIVVYRDRQDKIGFVELNTVSARLLDLIKEDKGKGGRDLLALVADEIKHPDPEVVIRGGHEIMQNLYKKDILLGTKSGRQ